MTYKKTYNQYLQKGIEDGSIPHREVDGVSVYTVRAPLPGEEVVGYVSTSDIECYHTPTERARHEAMLDCGD